MVQVSGTFPPSEWVLTGRVSCCPQLFFAYASVLRLGQMPGTFVLLKNCGRIYLGYLEELQACGQRRDRCLKRETKENQRESRLTRYL